MKSIVTFVQEVKVELAKVVWPTKDEFVGATIVALIVILAFALFLGIVNHAFNIGAQRLLAALVFGVR